MCWVGVGASPSQDIGAGLGSGHQARAQPRRKLKPASQFCCLSPAGAAQGARPAQNKRAKSQPACAPPAEIPAAVARI